MKLDQQRAIVEPDRRGKRLAFRVNRPIARSMGRLDCQAVSAAQNFFGRVVLVGNERTCASGACDRSDSKSRRDQSGRNKDCGDNPRPRLRLALNIGSLRWLVSVLLCAATDHGTRLPPPRAPELQLSERICRASSAMATARAEPPDGSVPAPRGPAEASVDNSPRHDGQAPRQKERYSCGSASGCAGTAEASGPGPAPSR